MDSIITKRCRICGEDKPLAEMSRRKDRTDGYDSCCLACHRLRYKQWAQANSEKVVAKRKRFYEQNPTYDRDYQRAHRKQKQLAIRKWAKTHPERIATYNKRWRAANVQRERERKQRWVEAHHETKRELDRQWRLENCEQARMSRRKSEQANLEAGRIRKHRRRAKKRVTVEHSQYKNGIH